MSDKPETVEVEIMQVLPTNITKVADWVNGSPNAWANGNYDDTAYPDVGGVEIPTITSGKHTHVFVMWGEYVIKFRDGFYRLAKYQGGK